MRLKWFVSAFFLAHYAASVLALPWAYITNSAHFDGHPVSFISRHLSDPVFEILWFPVKYLPRALALPGVWHYLWVALNSVLWTIVIVILFKKIGWIQMPNTSGKPDALKHTSRP